MSCDRNDSYEYHGHMTENIASLESRVSTRKWRRVEIIWQVPTINQELWTSI